MTRHGTITKAPPLILAIENSGQCGSVALVANGQCLCEYSLQSKITHSQRLLTGIEKIMLEAAIAWEEIDGIAVSLGPGSFTGLRIGLATAKGLAMAAGKKLIGVPTLDGLACQLAYGSRLICPITDARKNEVYAAFYRGNQDGCVTRVGDYLAITPDRLIRRITEPTVFVGDGVTVYGDLLRERLKDMAHFAPEELFFSRAAAIGWLAAKLWHDNTFLDPVTAVPIYIRPSEAEMLFNTDK